MKLSVIFSLILLQLNVGIDPSLIITEKNITINGKTSIGGFSCDYELSGKNDTLNIANLARSPYQFSIPVDAFKCGNFMLNRDFQSTLKAKEFPEIAVQVLSLKENKNGKLTGKLKFILVGKSKILDNIDFTLTNKGNNQVLATEFLFNTTDFDITPPKKLGGLIKTDDEMHITVELVVKKAAN